MERLKDEKNEKLKDEKNEKLRDGKKCTEGLSPCALFCEKSTKKVAEKFGYIKTFL